MKSRGLGSVDLNLRAQHALMGFSHSPDKDITDLLRSDEPIEPLTRRMLANAFGERDEGFHYRAFGQEGTAILRSMHLYLGRIKVGRTIVSEKKQSTDISRVEADWTQRLGLSLKSVQKFCALANKVDNWISKRQPKSTDPADLDHFHLTVACCYAITKNGGEWKGTASPEKLIKKSLPLVCRLLEDHHDQYRKQGLRFDVPILSWGIR